MSKRIRIIFTLSLIANILFLAVGAGLFYRFCRDDISIPGQMSPDARHFMARTFQEGREQVKPLIDEVKARRAVVEDVITAEQFDSKAYDAAVEKVLDTRDKISRQRAQIMGKALADLPQADREEFADRILDGLEGRRPPRGKSLHHKFMTDGKGGPPPGIEQKP